MTTLRTSAADAGPGRTRRRVLYRWLAVVVGIAALAGGAIVTALPAAATGTTWTMVSAGKTHTCAIMTGGTLWCWGANNAGQLGVGDTVDRNSPTVLMFGNSGWTWVSAGDDFTCGIYNGGSRLCWGANGSGQLGLGDYLNRSIPSHLDGEGSHWLKVDAGERHACGTNNNNTSLGLAAGVCWGANMYGQLGTADTAPRTVPTPIAITGHRWALMSAGSYHTCAMDTTFHRYCWGRNDAHQLGMIGASDPQLTPFHDAADGQYFGVDSGDGTSCVISNSGRNLECYGKNTYGNIGNGNTTPTDDIIAYGCCATTSSGGYHACAIDINGLLYCWGHNSAGQLGLGNTTDQHTVTQYLSGTFSKVSAGFMHTCAIGTNSLLYCWGYNARGQLGIGTRTNMSTPQPVF